MDKNLSFRNVDFALIIPYQEKAAFGARILHAYLRKRGYEVASIYFKKRSQDHTYPSSREISLLIGLVERIRPLLVGFSVMSPFNAVARLLTEQMRKYSDVPIVWGGIHATICPEDCIEVADVCCIGEGEEPLCSMLNSLKTEGRISPSTPNCWVRVNGTVVKNEMTCICQDLDSLPYPELSGENTYFITDDELTEVDPYVSYILDRGRYDFKAFRGCPFVCTYCGNKSIRDAYGPSGPYLRRRSVDSVIDELKAVRQRFPNIRSIHSYDELFITNSKFVKEFSEKYSREIHLPFTCDAVITTLDNEEVSMIAKAGLQAVNVGVEAFSEDVRLKTYRRKMTNSRIIEKAWLLHRHGVHVMYDFIYDNPLETPQDLERCFWDLIVRLPRPCNFSKYSLSHLPKTELTERFLAEGRISRSDVVGHSDKGLVQWKVTLDYKRDTMLSFWAILYDLYGFGVTLRNHPLVIPLSLLRLLARTRSLALASTVQKICSAVSSLIEGTFWKKARTKYRNRRGHSKAIPF